MKRILCNSLLTVIFIAFVVILFIVIQDNREKDMQTAAKMTESIKLPIIMYHSILKNPAAAGKYVVSPDVLRADLCYLKENGYTTVTFADLLNYVNDNGVLPSKAVMLTFDDGHLNNLTYVLPLLEEYDMQAVISVVGILTDQYTDHPDPNPNYAYLTWADLKAMEETGHIEIQNHSYDMHSTSVRQGCQRKTNESEAAYREALQADLMKMQMRLEEKSDIKACAFTYPFGLISPESGEYIKEMGFSATLTCYEMCNEITRDPDCLYGLGRYNRPSGIDTETFMQRVLGGGY